MQSLYDDDVRLTPESVLYSALSVLRAHAGTCHAPQLVRRLLAERITIEHTPTTDRRLVAAWIESSITADICIELLTEPWAPNSLHLEQYLDSLSFSHSASARQPLRINQ